MRALIAALFLVSLTACAAKQPAPATATAASFSQTELIARVKTALLNDAIVGARRIDVAAEGDRITLSGRVATAAESERAVQIARGVAGVGSVTSKLDIRP